MKWSRFISEFGIESRSDDEGRWLVKGASGEVLEVSPRQLAGEFGLRPIVGEAPLGRSGMTVDFLLSPSGDKALELQLSNLQQETGGIKNLRLEEHWLDLLYVLGAACYHCKRLAFSYGKLTHQAWDSARRQIARRRDRTSRVDLSGTFETYYEFDALVTAVVRCYESMRFVLWSAFGSQQGPIPRSFERTLKVCTKGPGDLREKLASSWARYGKKAKEYRDCIQHYVPVGNSVPSAHV